MYGDVAEIAPFFVSSSHEMFVKENRCFLGEGSIVESVVSNVKTHGIPTIFVKKNVVSSSVEESLAAKMPGMALSALSP